MEIKRRLDKIAKSMNPHIEISPSSRKLAALCKSLEEIIGYEQEKIDRTAARLKAGEPTVGKKVDDRRKAEAAEVAKNQEAEASQNADDQAEAHEARNKAHRERTGSTALDDAGKKPPPKPTTEESRPNATGTKKKAKKKKKK